jgi:hypothetical protein
MISSKLAARLFPELPFPELGLSYRLPVHVLRTETYVRLNFVDRLRIFVTGLCVVRSQVLLVDQPFAESALKREYSEYTGWTVANFSVVWRPLGWRLWLSALLLLMTGTSSSRAEQRWQTAEHDHAQKPVKAVQAFRES